MPPHDTPASLRARAATGFDDALFAALSDQGRENLEAYAAGCAPNTLLAFRADLARWVAWARYNTIDPLAPTNRNVRDWIAAFSADRSVGTAQRMIRNMSVTFERIAGVTNPAKSELVRAEVRRLKRQKGTVRKQAVPIRIRGDVAQIEDEAAAFSVERMVKALAPIDNHWGRRARLLLSLGIDGGRRTSEYLAANIGHIEPAADGSGVWTIPFSKTDQEGAGTERYLSRATMRLFRDWKDGLAADGYDVGPGTPLLRFFRCPNYTVFGRLTRAGFIYVIREVVRIALERAAEDEPELQPRIDGIVRGVSGHSFRVGMVQDLTIAGENIVAICIEGGWSTIEMAVLYGRKLGLRNGAMARLRRRLGDT